MIDPSFENKKRFARLGFNAALLILPLLLALLSWPGSAQAPTDPFSIYLPQISSQNTTASVPKPTATATTAPPGETGAASGRILWNSQPMAGVTVKLCTDWSIIGGCKTQAYTGVTGSDGRYTIASLPTGDYEMATITPGQQNETGWLGLKVTVIAGQTTVVPDVSVGKYDLKKLSPANNAILSATPSLFWETYPGAASYKVYVSNTDTHATVVLFEKVTSSTYVFAGPLAAGKYYWDIDAYGASGTQIASSSSGYYFTIAP